MDVQNMYDVFSQAFILVLLINLDRMIRLKLNSNKGGKFDIVFDSKLDFDESAKLSGNRATSAGRRKNNEWKSKVLPTKDAKEPHYKNVKVSKTTELRNSTIAKKYHPEKKTNRPTKPTKPATIPENESTHKNSKILQKQKKTVKSKKSTPSPTPKKKDFTRKSTFVFEDDNGGEIMITKEQLKAIQRDLCKDEAIAPTNIPGLDPEPPTTKHDQLDSSHNTSASTLDTSREDQIRQLQARPVEIYDPWGKPGAGAPTNTEDGKVRTHRNVRMLQTEKEGYQQKQSPESPDREKYQTSPAVSKETNQSDHFPKPSVHARGKGKQPHEITDLEKKKAKHFEHHQAIAAQVEEKRLQKQLEKERKIREEQEAEERYQKHQELINKRLEDEQQKEKEKQEAKLLKQKMLEEGIRKAEEEAKRAKEEARKARSKPQSRPQESKGGESDFSVMSPKYKRILHSENDTIRASQSYEEETVLEEFSKFYQEEPPKSNTKQRNNRFGYKPKDTYRLKSPEAEHTENSSRMTSNAKQAQILDDYMVPYHRTETAEMYDDDNQEEDTIEQPSQKPIRNKKEKKPTPLRKSSHHDESDEEEPRPVKSKTKSKEKASKEKSPVTPVRSNRPNSWTQQDQFEQGPISSPSTKRQQEILHRLAELRAGLKQKERECYEATWSK